MGYKFRKSRQELDNIILQSLINAGTVCLDKVLEYVMNRREEILKNHESHRSIWQNETTGKWHTKLGAKKTMVVRKERSNLENAIVEYYLLEESLSATFEEAFISFCNYMEETESLEPKSIDEYQNEYNLMIKNSTFSQLHMNTISEADLIRFLKSLAYRKDKLPSKRFSACKTVIRAVFNQAKLEMEIECITVKHIMDDLKFPSNCFKETTTDKNLQVFKLSETRKIKDLLANTTNVKELGILLTLETGLRLGELCVLKREDITDTHICVNHSEHKARIDGKYQYYIGLPKKKKKRKVVLSVEAKTILDRILTLNDSEWLFPSDRFEDSWMRSYCFDTEIRNVCERCDIPIRSMHKLRKTYASYLVHIGKDEKMVQEQLGHSDIKTTREHYQYNLLDDDQTVDALRDVKVG